MKENSCVTKKTKPQVKLWEKKKTRSSDPNSINSGFITTQIFTIAFGFLQTDCP